MLLAVYGTLRRDHYNHYLLEDCPLHSTIKLSGTLIVPSGCNYPMFINGGNTPIVCEVYSINGNRFNTIARMEKAAGYELSNIPHPDNENELNINYWSHAPVKSNFTVIESGDFNDYK